MLSLSKKGMMISLAGRQCSFGVHACLSVVFGWQRLKYKEKSSQVRSWAKASEEKVSGFKNYVFHISRSGSEARPEAHGLLVAILERNKRLFDFSIFGLVLSNRQAAWQATKSQHYQAL